MRISGALLLLFGAISCGGGARPDLTSLEVHTGCDDLYVVLAATDDRDHLVFRALNGPVAALRAGAPSLVYDLAATESGAVVFAEHGVAVSGGICGLPGDPTIDSRYHGVSGTVTLTLDTVVEPDVLLLAFAGVTLGEELGDGRVALADRTVSLAVTW